MPSVAAALPPPGSEAGWQDRPVPMVDLIDETFVVAAPARVAAALRDPTRADDFWPGLALTVFQDRGDAGVRWTVTGAMVGSAEVWIEPWGDGTLVHLYLRADPTRRGSATQPRGGSAYRLARLAVRERRRRAWRIKRAVWALKRELEGDRVAGEAPAAAAAVVSTSRPGLAARQAPGPAASARESIPGQA